MKRFHVHAHVADLAASISFYSKLFGAEPTRVEADYARRMIDDPRLNFAISTRGGDLGARSVLAEGMLNHWAARLGRDVRAHSAGSAPSGRVNAFALEVLHEAGIDTSGYRSKGWDEFSAESAPPLTVVITVCDSAAAEQCAVFFGGTDRQPVKVHWGYPDPSNAAGGEDGKRAAFELTRQPIGYRMLQLLQLPVDTLAEPELRQALVAVGKS